MNRVQSTYGFQSLSDNCIVGGIFVDRRDVVVSVVTPTHLPAREVVT